MHATFDSLAVFFFYFHFVVSFVIVWLMHKKFERVDEISTS